MEAMSGDWLIHSIRGSAAEGMTVAVRATGALARERVRGEVVLMATDSGWTILGETSTKRLAKTEVSLVEVTV
jgi:hypothetical protein